jgi:YHS domain-containing protein
VDGKIYYFSPKGAVPAFRRLCGLASLRVRRGGFFRAKAQRRKEILIPSEAVDGKIYFFLAKAQFRIRRRGLCDLAALRD